MKNVKYENNISAISSAVRSPLPLVEFKAHSSAGTDLARVVIDVTHTPESREDAGMVTKAIANKLSGRFQAVAGSFYTVEKGPYTERVIGVISAVRDVVAVNEESLKGFKAIASNMFMDEEKDMWTLRKTEAGDILIKTSAEDDLSLSHLLESVSSSGFRSSPSYKALSSLCSEIPSKVKGGDFVTYVDYNNNTAEGFVVATTTEGKALVIQCGAEESDEVSLEAVIGIHNQSNFPEVELTPQETVDQEVALSSGRLNVEAIIAYYKKIYSSSPKFFAEFSKRIRQHAFA